MKYKLSSLSKEDDQSCVFKQSQTLTGRLNVASWQKVTPRDQISVFAVQGSFSHISGVMYGIVPVSVDMYCAVLPKRQKMLPVHLMSFWASSESNVITLQQISNILFLFTHLWCHVCHCALQSVQVRCSTMLKNIRKLFGGQNFDNQ